MFGILLPLALAACTATPAHEARQAPLRIASLNPCSDAILAEVADPAQIAGLSSYSSDPASSSMDLTTARRFPALGDSVEEVAAVRPDVVLATDFLAPASAASLERMGMRLERVGMAPTVADSLTQVRQIARIAGHPERGEALVARGIPRGKIRRWVYAFPTRKEEYERSMDLPGLGETRDLHRGVWVFRSDC